MYKYPILLDACANEMQRQGDSMMSKWAEVRSFVKLLQAWSKQSGCLWRGALPSYLMPWQLLSAAGTHTKQSVAQVMTNMRPKSYFLRPDVALPLGIALLRELWAQKVQGRKDLYQ